MTIKRNDFVNYDKPVKSKTADIPGQVVPIVTPVINNPITKDPNNDNPVTPSPPNVDTYKYYYGKSDKIGVEESDIDNLLDTYNVEVVDSHIELPEGNGYGFILIPETMKQPSMFRNSENGCNGFAIPMIYQGDIGIGEISKEITYKMYRTYVPTYAKVDIWLCE